MPRGPSRSRHLMPIYNTLPSHPPEEPARARPDVPQEPHAGYEAALSHLAHLQEQNRPLARLRFPEPLEADFRGAYYHKAQSGYRVLFIGA